MRTTIPPRLTAMHHLHVARGADMETRDGWQRPRSYGSADQEAAGAREGAGICDVSPAGKLLIYGDALDVVARAFGADDGAPAAGSVARWEMSSADGVEIARVARTAPDELFAVTRPAATDAVSVALEWAAPDATYVVDVTSGLAGVMLVGPLAHDVLAAVTELDVAPEAFGNMACAQSAFADVRATLLRIDAGELPAYELYFDRSYGEYMWETLLTATGDGWPVPVGVDAMDSLR